MRNESDFLSLIYVMARLKNIKEIRNGNVLYDIQLSNKSGRSLYISLYGEGIDGSKKRLKEIRISDHYINKLSSKDYIQFIIKPNNAITAEKSIQFNKMIVNAIHEAYYHQIGINYQRIKNERNEEDKE